MVSLRVFLCAGLILLSPLAWADEIAQFEGWALKDLKAEIAKTNRPLTTRFSDGFAVIQMMPYEKTVKDYVENSRAGYGVSLEGKYDYKVNKQTDEEFEVEAVGFHKGTKRRLHFIVRGILWDGNMYWFTATTAEGSWDAMGATLTKYVESFHK